jgi:hypothetical protein
MKLKTYIPSWWKGTISLLPKTELFPRTTVVLPKGLHKHLNTINEPCRVFLTDINYTGIDCLIKRNNRFYKKSSDNFVRKIARLAGYPPAIFINTKGTEIESALKKDDAYTKHYLLSRRK